MNIEHECPNDFWHKIKIYNFDPYNVFLAMATNISQQLTIYWVTIYSCDSKAKLSAAITPVSHESMLQKSF